MAVVGKTREIWVQTVLSPSSPMKQREGTVHGHWRFLVFLVCNVFQLQFLPLLAFFQRIFQLPLTFSLQCLYLLPLHVPKIHESGDFPKRFLCSFRLPVSSPLPPYKPWFISTHFLVCACFFLWQHFYCFHSPAIHPLHVFSLCTFTIACQCIPCWLPFRTSCCFFLPLLCWPHHFLKKFGQRKYLSFVCLFVWLLVFRELDPLLNIFSAVFLIFSALPFLLLPYHTEVTYCFPLTHPLQFSLTTKV